MIKFQLWAVVKVVMKVWKVEEEAYELNCLLGSNSTETNVVPAKSSVPRRGEISHLDRKNGSKEAMERCQHSFIDRLFDPFSSHGGRQLLSWEWRNNEDVETSDWCEATESSLYSLLLDVVSLEIWVMWNSWKSWEPWGAFFFPTKQSAGDRKMGAGKLDEKEKRTEMNQKSQQENEMEWGRRGEKSKECVENLAVN